ncbi:MAG: nickel pincer cofactor biosynthesis protein LarC [Thermoproteota archaeon]|nr:nickel pincer cofactor biosynthesis protein LarC [Thermoproteota archaeon]
MAMPRVAIIDSQVAGIAGDMLMSSLVDAGASKTKVIEAIFACPNFLKDSTITDAHFAKVTSHSFAATQLQMRSRDRVFTRKGTEMYSALARCCDSVGLEHRAKTFALDSLKMIISAEATIHGQNFDNVHLHEASSIDTLADLVGCATALQDLQLFDAKMYSTKVAIGGGLLSFSHGTIPNPASAILEIFKNKGFILVGGQAEHELTTPTGAAMLVNLVHGSVNHYPNIAPEKIGYGAGIKKFEGFPNVVRVVIGTSGSVYETTKDTVYVVETNIDDTSGEIVGNLIEQLSDVAKDVTVISGTTKKNRPTYLIRVISESTQLNNVLELLFNESGTLGARVQEVQRIVLPREIFTMSVNINDNTLDVRVKIVKDSSGQITNVKPEFEDIKVIATKCQIPVKRAMDQVKAEVIKKLKGG